MYICRYVGMSIYIYIYTHKYSYICIDIFSQTYRHAYTCVFNYVYLLREAQQHGLERPIYISICPSI